MKCFQKKALEAQGGTLCAYLVALAAFQAGLIVTFIREPKLVPNARCGLQNYNGSVFTLSDGGIAYHFHRTMGSLTSVESQELVGNKHATKATLKAMSVPCPDGIEIETAAALQDRRLFQKLGFPKVVCKPIKGSFGSGVYVGIETQEQLTKALEAQDRKVQRVVLEEHIEGTERRYYVANGKVVAVTRREPANVVGDGSSSIRELIDQKNSRRRQNPHLASRLMKESLLVRNEIERQGFSGFLDVPAKGQKVQLSGVANLSAGGDSIDDTDRVSESSKNAAVAAATAVGVSNCGIDMISVSGPEGDRDYVIEVNARAQIGSHSFPMHGVGQRNRVSEEIVSAYFSNVSSRLRHVHFSFSAVQRMLRKRWVASVRLPCLADRDSYEIIVKAPPLAQLDLVRDCKDMFGKSGALGEVRRMDLETLAVRLIVNRAQYEEFVHLLTSSPSGYRVLATRPSSEPIDAAVTIFGEVHDEGLEVQYDYSMKRAVSDVRVAASGARKAFRSLGGSRVVRNLAIWRK